MALITSTRDGKPLYRARWNYRREDGRLRYDEKRFRRKADATAFLRRVSPTTTPGTERITVAELMDAFRDNYYAAVDPAGNRNCAKRTEKDYREQDELRIRPFLGRKRLSKLTPLTLDEWKVWMLEQERTVRRRRLDQNGKPLRDALPNGKPGKIIYDEVILRTSAASANKSITVFKRAVRWGRKRGLTELQFVDDMDKLPQSEPDAPNPYTPDEVKRIGNGCRLLRDEALIYTAAYSGLRWSEICALRWTDIDWAAATIDLQRSLDVDRTTKSPKSKKHRIVPVLEPGMVALREWRKAAPEKSILVFPDEKGGALRSNWYRPDRNLGEIRRACGIHFEPHQLRDTYASILIQSGIGEAELTLWLGHKSVQTTIRKYGKLFERRKAALASKANEFLATL